MNTRTKLNTLLLATLLLSPMAFADGGQTQPASSAETDTACVPVAVEQTNHFQGTASVSRATLQRIDLETRQAVLNSLRDSGFMTAVMQAAAPVLDAVGSSLQLGATSR